MSGQQTFVCKDSDVATHFMRVELFVLFVRFVVFIGVIWMLGLNVMVSCSVFMPETRGTND